MESVFRKSHLTGFIIKFMGLIPSFLNAQSVLVEFVDSTWSYTHVDSSITNGTFQLVNYRDSLKSDTSQFKDLVGQDLVNEQGVMISQMRIVSWNHWVRFEYNGNANPWMILYRTNEEKSRCTRIFLNDTGQIANISQFRCAGLSSDENEFNEGLNISFSEMGTVNKLEIYSEGRKFFKIKQVE